MKLHEQAFQSPANSGLSKLEYASIHILAGMLSNRQVDDTGQPSGNQIREAAEEAVYAAKLLAKALQ